MKLTSSFSVPLPLADAWDLLQDIDRVARWFPGARLEDSAGEEFRGTVRVKLGPMMVDYRGTARFAERDEEGRKVVIEATGREQRGAGTARATAVTSLRSDGAETEVSVAIDLDITGRPAQLGQGLLQEVTQKLVAEFASRMALDLAAAVGGAEGAPVAGTEASPGSPGASGPPGADGRPAEATARPRAAGGIGDDEDVLDLGRVAGTAVARRALPVLAGLAALAVAAWSWRRRAAEPAPSRRRARSAPHAADPWRRVILRLAGRR